MDIDFGKFAEMGNEPAIYFDSATPGSRP